MRVENYEAGVPSWVDFSATDVAKAVAFYSELFGWQTEDMGEQAGHYHMVMKDGAPVAGIGPLMSPGPAHWTTYVNVDNADETSAKVEGAKGTVLLAPMDVMEAGRMAIFADPAGAAIGIWQAGQHRGAGIVNESGTWIWSNCLSRDVEASSAFYSQVFGWQAADDESMGPGGKVFSVSGRMVASAMPMPADVPAGVPSYWDPTFVVDDADKAAEQVRGLGGTVVMGPADFPPGRLAAAVDPQGAMFSFMALRES